MRAAVLGSPIAHSLSPVLHRAGYAALGLAEWTYDRFELVAADLPGFVGGLGEEWRGLSLTMPLKAACLEVATEVTPLADRAGAGNTLVRRPDGGWLADNTDVPGLVDALRPGWDPAWREAAVLGSGATARSAVLALAELGVTGITVYARSGERGAALAGWAGAVVPGLAARVSPLAHWADGAEPVVLSTLPGGAADSLTLPKPRAGLLFDAVYAGWPTPLAASARDAGMRVVSGLDLLVHQAARQFELFTGHRAPLAALFAAGRAALAPAGGEPTGATGSVVLVGFMGAGKSNAGARVAEALGRPFVDSDAAIEAADGRAVRTIFAEEGEAGFRRIEAATIVDVLGGPPVVLALGGGSLGSGAVRAALAGHQVVLLDVGLAEALARVGGDESRPMLSHPDLPALYAGRQRAYRDAAGVVVAVDGLTKEETAQAVLAALGVGE